MVTDEARSTTDITVNLDGLWLMQALLGIARLAPELRGPALRSTAVNRVADGPSGPGGARGAGHLR